MIPVILKYVRSSWRASINSKRHSRRNLSQSNGPVGATP